MEVSALDMGQRTQRYALLKDAPRMLNKEECASVMEQRSSVNDAVAKDVKTLFDEEDCAQGMDQRSSESNVAEKVAQTKSNAKECVGGMGAREVSMQKQRIHSR